MDHIMEVSCDSLRQLGVGNRVTFFGGSLSREEILRRYSNADLAILLSEHECFGLTIAEALASGTVCIVTNTTALTEWVDNKNCFGVQYPINMKELIGLINATLGKSVSDPKIVDWSDVVSKILNVYKGDSCENMRAFWGSRNRVCYPSRGCDNFVQSRRNYQWL